MATQAWKDANQEKMRAYRRDWYAKNKEQAKQRVKARRASLKKWYADLRSKLVCSKCEEDHPACIVFHHQDPTTKEVALSEAVIRGFSKKRILGEIEKCVILCANCHRKLHYEERQIAVRAREKKYLDPLPRSMKLF